MKPWMDVTTPPRSNRRPGWFHVRAMSNVGLYPEWTVHPSEEEAIAAAKAFFAANVHGQVIVMDHNGRHVWEISEPEARSETFRRADREDGAVDLHPLLKRAHEISVDRAGQYGDWQSTARTYCPDDLSEYPRAMVRAKLARDPDLQQADTLVDLVNYLGMIFELGTDTNADES